MCCRGEEAHPWEQGTASRPSPLLWAEGTEDEAVGEGGSVHCISWVLKQPGRRNKPAICTHRRRRLAGGGGGSCPYTKAKSEPRDQEAAGGVQLGCNLTPVCVCVSPACV